MGEIGKDWRRTWLLIEVGWTLLGVKSAVDCTWVGRESDLITGWGDTVGESDIGGTGVLVSCFWKASLRERDKEDIKRSKSFPDFASLSSLPFSSIRAGEVWVFSWLKLCLRDIIRSWSCCWGISTWSQQLAKNISILSSK